MYCLSLSHTNVEGEHKVRILNYVEGETKMSIVVKDKELILEQLQRNLSEKREVVSGYEENEIYELAYLIKWQIVEETIKEIAKAQRRLKLLDNLNEWIQYLTMKSKKQPSKINSFSIDSNKIPNIDLILQYFEKTELSHLNELMKSKGKYRERRNAIAHKFNKFRSKEVYMEYAQKTDAAIDELIEALASG